MGGWVCLWRSIMDHPVWEDPTTLKVFLWCVLTARREAKEWRGDMLQPGQFSTGRNVASRELGLHPSSVYRAFDRLTAMGCITVEANRVRTIVTVCNWSSYQEQKEGDRTSPEQDASKDRTSSEQEANTIQQGNKETREQVSKKTRPAAKTPAALGYPDDFERFWKVYPRHEKKGATARIWETILKRLQEERQQDRETVVDYLVQRAEEFSRSPAGKAGQYTPHPSTWLSTRRFEDDDADWKRDSTVQRGSAPPPGPGQRYDPASIVDENELVGTL